MKKVYTTIFLFVSLFFFYSSGVKADTYNFTIDSTNVDIINDTFLQAKEAADIVVSSGKYMIFYKNSKYYRYSLTSEEIIVTFSTDNFSFSISDFNEYYYDGTQWVWNGYIPGTKTITLINNSSVLDYSLFVYTPMNFIYSGDSTINITYKNYTETIDNGDTFPSLYNYYLNNSLVVPEEPEEPEEDTHVEEKQLLSNFYTLIIEKIVLLANSIAENYILLTVIGIFILIFLIYLIRRYLL